MVEEGDRSQCLELLKLATPQLYRRNLFRVLNLPVGATPADVRRQQKRVEMQRKLGVASSSGTDGALRLVPSPTDEDIRAAMDRFNDPEARLLDELFWFWPLQDGNPATDAALQALERGEVNEASEIWRKQIRANGHGQIATHNLAVLDHMVALDGEWRLASGSLDAEQKARLPQMWSQALGRWGEVLDGEDFWSRVKDRVREINDVKLTTGLVHRMRIALPKALLLINATMACGAAERKDGDGAKRHVQIVHEAKYPEGLAEGALREALQTIRNRLKLICEDAKKQAEQDRIGAAQIARDVEEKARPLLGVLDHILPTDDPTCRGMHDDVALAMDLCCGFHWNQVKDATVTAELLELTLGIAWVNRCAKG